MRIFCAACGSHHDGVARLDPTGWPTVRWEEGVHDPDELRQRELLDLIVDEAAAGFVLACTRNDFDVAAAFANEVLDRNDEEEPS